LLAISLVHFALLSCANAAENLATIFDRFIAFGWMLAKSADTDVDQRARHGSRSSACKSTVLKELRF